MRTYLDHNATSPLRPSARSAMLAALDAGGNASSVHAEGRAARKILDDARETLGFAFGCLPEMMVFTSGGTEANTMALRGVEAERILVSAVEHPSALAAARASGKTVEIIPVDREGRVDLAALEKMIAGPNVLVSVMLANNETGVIQPIADVVALARKAGALVHVDAVQGFGKMPVNFGVLGCDLMTVAAHKVGGPVGVGALIIRDGLVVEPLLNGGGQELRRRAGTENLAGVAGWAAVAKENAIDTKALRDELDSSLEGAVILGMGAERLPNTTCFAMPGFRAETLLMNFDLAGIAVSSGSACSSGKVGRSHVLDAMGVAPELAAAAIRVSLGWTSTAADVRHFVTVWKQLVARQRARQAA
ncbi:cysteine desulfurase family protein [Aestuariivirga sp.]|uniref:cysteine desulfurase family protein n=1 Tax=Aestuariivirga sp. TaxID=2650926 RepID=UPI0039E42595